MQGSVRHGDFVGREGGDRRSRGLLCAGTPDNRDFRDVGHGGRTDVQFVGGKRGCVYGHGALAFECARDGAGRGGSIGAVLFAEDEVAAAVRNVLDDYGAYGAVELGGADVSDLAAVELIGAGSIVRANVPAAVAVGVGGGVIVTLDIGGRILLTI